jgi:hypothetical protein
VKYFLEVMDFGSLCYNFATSIDHFILCVFYVTFYHHNFAIIIMFIDAQFVSHKHSFRIFEDVYEF